MPPRRRPRPWLLALWAALSLGVATPAAAQPPSVPPSVEDVTVTVLTFGPGDHPFFKFGHNAIWIQKPGHSGVVYNFGTFAFDTPNLIGKFLQGRFRYWLSRASIDDTLWSYQSTDRTIIAQQLDLPPNAARALERRLEDNARPEHREYLYDYFYDNCSTRVRDAIDSATGGRVRAAAAVPGRLTFRGHALRLVSDLLWEYVGLDVLLGIPVDRPITEWDEDFIPEVFQATLRKTTLVVDGQPRPLVRDERVIYASTQPAPPAEPPRWTAWFGLAGVLFGGLLVAMGRLGRRSRVSRVALGLVVSLVGLVAGVVGLVMPLLWAFTNHRAAHLNENILQIPPWSVVLVAIGIGVTLDRRSWQRAMHSVALASTGTAALGWALKALPAFFQVNGPVIAFFVPLWAGLAIAAAALVRNPTVRASHET